ncbi:hypothetical protein P3S67_031081 [Capsicum chacoense]
MKSEGEYGDTSVQVKTEGAEILLNQAKQEIYYNDHFQNHLSQLYLDFIVQVDQLIEIAKKFDFDGFVIISRIDSKTNGCLFAANFSCNRKLVATALVAMLQGWKDLKSRSECKMKLQVLHPTGYILIAVIETIYLVVCHILHHGLANVYAVAGQVITELNLILLTSFTGNKEKHGCNWLIAWQWRDLVEKELLKMFIASFDPNSTLDDILSIPLFNTNAYSLVDYVIMSFGREGIDAKKGGSDEGIEGHLIAYLCHVSQQLNKNDATTSTIIQAGNQVTSLLLTNYLTVPEDALAYLNLEDKVLF